MMYKIIESLANTSSRNDKIDILKRNKTNTLLAKIISLTLDPFTNFYIKKIPKYRTNIPTLSLVEALAQLENLSSRKVTGNAGIELLRETLSSLDEDDAKILERVIQKDLKCGVAAGIVNAAWGDNFIPEYPCMLCSPFDQKLANKITYPAYVQLKLDGMRFSAIVKKVTDIESSIEYRSRNGKEIVFNNALLDQQFISLAHSLNLDNCVFDGELLVVDKNNNPLDRQTGNGILNKSIKGTISDNESQMIRATVWDYIPYEYFISGSYVVQYGVRFSILSKALNRIESAFISCVETHEVNSIDEAWDIFNKYLQSGQEGIILKTKNGKWENKRSKSQVKFKAELDCDLVVKDYVYGTGKYEKVLGALICETSDGLLSVGIGSGFTDEQRQNLTPENTIGKIVAIRYNSLIRNKNGNSSLFLPRILEIREDKDKADLLKDIK